MDAVNLPVFLDSEKHRSELNGKYFTNLSMSASRKDGKYLLSVTNLDPEKEKTITVDLRGAITSKIEGRILTGRKRNSHNNFDDPTQVVPEDFTDISLKDGTLSCTVPAHSFFTFNIA
jgi:alpha-N-arabinofuranosidase